VCAGRRALVEQQKAQKEIESKKKEELLLEKLLKQSQARATPACALLFIVHSLIICSPG
jgi:hypothetical protein